MCANRPLPDLPDLEVWCRDRRALAAGRPVSLPAANFAFYAAMARRAANGRSFSDYWTPGFADDYLYEYDLATHECADRANRERVRCRLQFALHHFEEYKNWFNERKSRVNSDLRRQLGEGLAHTYGIKRRGTRPHTVFGIDIAPSRIRIRDG